MLRVSQPSMMYSESSCNVAKSRLLIRSVVFAFLALTSFVSSAQEIERVAVFEQWPGVSQLITYRDRIWFVNSKPFEDSNVADIYSYSVEDGSLRYERGLFSQDVGRPVIYDGLLHWPFEDPRRSAGSGEYVVTDGTNWQWQVMQSGSVMHVHAMNVCDGDLVATTGAWTGQFHRLSKNKTEEVTESSGEEPDDQSDQPSNNYTWEVKYDYPAAKDSFSRLVSVSQFGDSCIVGASARRKDEAKLFTIDGGKRTAINGWPSSDRVDTLEQHQGNLFAFADTGSTRQLMRYDGSVVHQVALPSNHHPRALHSDGNNLWLATHQQGEPQPGALWKYDNAGDFERIEEFAGVPNGLGSYKGVVAVGTYAASGGALWLYKHEALHQSPIEPDDSSAAISSDPLHELDSDLVDSLYAELLAVITDPNSTVERARVLRRSLGRHPLIKAPEFGAAVTRLLSTPLEGAPIPMFTGRSISYEGLIHWYLMTTLAINGHGYIDPAVINSEKELDVPDSMKVFSPSIAAIVASGWLKQSDDATLSALMTRLNSETDPLWVRADVIAALSAITDQRFGYAVTKWNDWWEKLKG